MQHWLSHNPRTDVQLLIVLITFITSGCSFLGMSSRFDEFSAHAEQVFRHQNVVIEKIMQLNEDSTGVSDKAISQAELNMYDQCRLLNEYAIRERDGQEQNYFDSQEILDSIDGCETSINAVEKLLIK